MAKTPTRIYLSPPSLEPEAFTTVQAALASNWIAPIGPDLDRFEHMLGGYSGSSYVLGLQSGTAALHLAFLSLGIQAGDEVVCPSFTFAAGANAVCYTGARPVFVDCEAKTWNMCPDALEELLLSRKRANSLPAAILLVHNYGTPGYLDKIFSLSNQYGIPIIEDAAEALGASYEGRKLGTLGKVGVYSFNGNKIITTSSGGALLTDDYQIYEKALHLSQQAKRAVPGFEHDSIGYNYRLSNILAALGCSQLQALDKRVAHRRAIFQQYTQFLDQAPVEFQEELSQGISNRWLTCVLLPNRQSREQVRIALEAQGIESRPLWKPLASQAPYATFGGANSYQIAQKLYERGLALPSGYSLSAQDMLEISKIVTNQLME